MTNYDYSEHLPKPRPTKEAVHLCCRRAEELLLMLLSDDDLLRALAAKLGATKAVTLLKVLDSVEALERPRGKAGRRRLPQELEAKARRHLAEWDGKVNPYFKRGSPTVPGNEFTQWFCDQMWPTATTSQCRSVLKKIHKKKQPI